MEGKKKSDLSQFLYVLSSFLLILRKSAKANPWLWQMLRERRKKKQRMRRLRRVVGVAFTVIAGMALTVTLQVGGIFPQPFDIPDLGSELHPLYAFPPFVYPMVTLTIAGLAVLLQLQDKNS
ncbi:MAG: hypothetical protein AAB565_02425 [Patescibacteria group bacterium]